MALRDKLPSMTKRADVTAYLDQFEIPYRAGRALMATH